MTRKQPTPTAIPLYLQISESLIRQIAIGRLSDGERLPPERNLAAEYRTTVRTLRKSLAELEKQGLLERIQGSGNYIRSANKTGAIYSMFRLELHSGGGLPSAEFLDVSAAEKPQDLPQFGSENWGTRFRRLRFLDDVPIAVEEIWLDGGAGKVDPDKLSDSLYRFYRLNMGFWISRAEDRVGLGQVPGWAPDGFGKAPNETVGYIERHSWAQGPLAIEFSRTWYDTDKALYVQRIT